MRHALAGVIHILYASKVFFPLALLQNLEEIVDEVSLEVQNNLIYH